MKRMKLVAALLAVSFMFAGAGFAKNCNSCKGTNVEAYAHPSLFGSQTFEYSTDDGAYIKGGDVVKPKYSLAIRGKNNTIIKTWANGILAFIKSQYSNAELFSFVISLVLSTPIRITYSTFLTYLRSITIFTKS